MKEPFLRSAAAFRSLAGIAFFVTIVLIPVRLRIVLLPRPSLPVHADFTDFLLFAPDVAMWATIIFWAASVVAVRRRIRFGPLYLWLPLAGLSLAGLLSVVASADRALTIYHVVRLAALSVFFLYIVNEATALAAFVVAVALQAMIQSVVAVAQFLSQYSVGLQVLGEQLLDPAWKGVSIVASGSVRVLRAYGLSDHPNILGGCLACGLIVLLATYLSSKWETQRLLLIPFVLMTLALLVTFSRSAWLAFAAGAALLLGIDMALHQRAHLRSLSWLVLGCILVLAPFIWKNADLLRSRLSAGGAGDPVPQEEQSIGERFLLIGLAERIFSDHALTGIGLGASPVALWHAYPALTTDFQPPHFTLMDAALETGLAGAVSYFLLLVLPWAALLRHSRVLARPQVAGAAALLLALTVVGFFDYYTWLLVPGRLWQWMSWGLLGASLQTTS